MLVLESRRHSRHLSMRDKEAELGAELYKSCFKTAWQLGVIPVDKRHAPNYSDVQVKWRFIEERDYASSVLLRHARHLGRGPAHQARRLRVERLTRSSPVHGRLAMNWAAPQREALHSRGSLAGLGNLSLLALHLSAIVPAHE